VEVGLNPEASATPNDVAEGDEGLYKQRRRVRFCVRLDRPDDLASDSIEGRLCQRFGPCSGDGAYGRPAGLTLVLSRLGNVCVGHRQPFASEIGFRGCENQDSFFLPDPHQDSAFYAILDHLWITERLKRSRQTLIPVSDPLDQLLRLNTLIAVSVVERVTEHIFQRKIRHALATKSATCISVLKVFDSSILVPHVQFCLSHSVSPSSRWT
jgi:hypothetical protein